MLPINVTMHILLFYLPLLWHFKPLFMRKRPVEKIGLFFMFFLHISIDVMHDIWYYIRVGEVKKEDSKQSGLNSRQFREGKRD